MNSYNATVYRIDRLRGDLIGTFVAEVNADGQMLRSNWIQFSGLEGTPRYDAYLRRTADCDFQIVQDNCAGYRERLRGLMLPPAYKR